MRLAPRAALVGSVIVSIVALDQVTKAIAGRLLGPRGPIPFLWGAARLSYTENPGALLSLGSGLSPEARSWIFVGIVGAALAFLLVVVLLDGDLAPRTATALALVLGGGFGNLIDRIALGRVRDFVFFGVGWLTTGVFNVADTAITAGTVLVIGGWLVNRLRRVRTRR